MEAEQQAPENGEQGTKGGGSYMCRQSSTRWTPTPEQIRILKDLYYNRGIRSPNGEQIQSISATLRQYGKIEGKNVFYWFQNHKARERQKKRFTSDHQQQQHLSFQATPPIPNPSSWTKPSPPNPNTYIYSNFTSSGFFPASSSSASGITVGQMGNSYGYGSVTMEKSFRECSISSGGSKIQNNYGWVPNNGIDPYYSFFDHHKSMAELQEQAEEDEIKAEEIETLPLFPTQREDIINMNGFCSNKNNNNNPTCYSYSTSSPTSLELSLNSYTFQGPDS